MRKIISIFLLLAACYAHYFDNSADYTDVNNLFNNKKNPTYPVTMYLMDDTTRTYDIYLDNYIEQSTKKINTASYVYRQHYHPAEYRAGDLYIVRKKEDKRNKNIELWRYTRKETYSLIHASPRFDFRVNFKDTLIAVLADDALIFYDTRGRNIKTYFTKTVRGQMGKAESLQLLDWSYDSRYLWLGGINARGLLTSLYVVDPITPSIQRYSLKNIPIGYEYAFNPNLPQLAYSDYKSPRKRAKGRVTLYHYDPIQNKNEAIVSGNNAFMPRWVDNSNIEFNGPKNKERVMFSIKSH